jgi:hypothetical protein
MLLNELLDSKVKSEVQTETAGKFVVSALIGDAKKNNERRIVFSASLEEDEENAWEVAFYELKDGVKTYSLTGRGDELKVFSFVSAALQEFIDRYHPEVFSFSADKDGDSDTRASLYKRLMDKNLKGYEGTQTKMKSSTMFSYTRKDVTD